MNSTPSTPTPGISFNAVTGVLTIRGTDAYYELVTVQADSTKVFAILNTRISLGNHVQQTQVASFDISKVKSVAFYGYAGNNSFSNLTSVPSEAWGGDGIDTLHRGHQQ